MSRDRTHVALMVLLSGMFGVLMSSLTVPAEAQENGPLVDEAAQITESVDDGDETTANRVVVVGVNCEVDEGATIIVSDANGTEVTLTDGENVDIRQGQKRVVLIGRDEGRNFDGVSISGDDFGPSDGTERGMVVSSTGIECDDDESKAKAGVSSGNVQAANLVRLSCEELLQRFRDDDEREAGGNGQYSDGPALADADVQDRIAFCLEREIVNVPNDDLPDTGGLPLLGIAVLGLASVVAGVSVIRAVGREE